MAKTKLDRLLSILLLLRASEWVSAKDLSERFGTSLRTVYRDIEELQEHGIPVRGIPGPDGGYRLASDDPIDPLLFAGSDALSLYILGFGGTGLSNNIERRMERVLTRMQDVVTPEDMDIIERLRRRIHFDTTDWYWRDEGTPLLPQIRTAVINQKSVRIKLRERRETHVIELDLLPYGLVWKAGQWYIVGLRMDTGAIERLRVNRIVELEVTDHKFDYPSGFRLEEWWKSELGGYGKGEVRVILAVKGEARTEIMRLITKDTSSIEQVGDTSYVTLFVDRWEWLIPLVLSYGESVYVVEPSDLRNVVVQSLKATLKTYKSGAVEVLSRFHNDDSRLRATYGREA